MTSLPIEAGILYMPEGYVGEKIDEFITVLNSSDKEAKGTATIYYDDGEKQEFAISFPPKQRSGLTLKDTVKPNRRFSTKLSTDYDITASLIHYDNGSALGADFSPVLSKTWTIAEGFKSDNTRDYLTIFNPSDSTIEVKLSLSGGVVCCQNKSDFTLTIGKQRRFSVDLHQFVTQNLNSWNKTYGIIIESPEPIVAALSHYDTDLKDGVLLMGHPNLGEPEGIVSEGWISPKGFEFVNILNPSEKYIKVTLTAIFNEGGVAQDLSTQYLYSYQRLGLYLNDFLPKEKPYMLRYKAEEEYWDPNTQQQKVRPTNVTAEFLHYDLNGLNGVGFSNTPAKHWEFSEGYYDDTDPNRIQEYLLIYNTTLVDSNIKVTIYYDDGKDPTILNLPVKAKSKDGFALHAHDSKANLRKRIKGGIWYGIMIDADQPVIPYFTHYDTKFGGSFALNGTPHN